MFFLLIRLERDGISCVDLCEVDAVSQLLGWSADRHRPSTQTVVVDGLNVVRLKQSIHALVLDAAFDVEAGVGSPKFLELFGRELLVDLLNVDEFLDGEDLTGDLLRDGMVDGLHALTQTEGLEDARGLLGQTDR